MTAIPPHDPLYGVPYVHSGSRWFKVYCETREETIREILAYTPFEYVTNMFEVYVASHPDVPGGSAAKVEYTLGSYRESGIHIPAKYKEVVGTYTAYMFVTSDAAMAAAREVFGYPKKLAEIDYVEDGNTFRGRVVRGGTELINVAGETDDRTSLDIPEVFAGPRILLKVIPRADGPGDLVRKVVIRESPENFVLYSRKFGRATVALGGSGTDALYRLTPTRVAGASISIGDIPFVWASKEEDF